MRFNLTVISAENGRKMTYLFTIFLLTYQLVDIIEEFAYALLLGEAFMPTMKRHKFASKYYLNDIVLKEIRGHSLSLYCICYNAKKLSTFLFVAYDQ